MNAIKCIWIILSFHLFVWDLRQPFHFLPRTRRQNSSFMQLCWGAHASKSDHHNAHTHTRLFKFWRDHQIWDEHHFGAHWGDSQRCLEACKMGHQSIHPHTPRIEFIYAPAIMRGSACVRRGFSRRILHTVVVFESALDADKNNSLTHILSQQSLTLHNPATFVIYLW